MVAVGVAHRVLGCPGLRCSVFGEYSSFNATMTGSYSPGVAKTTTAAETEHWLLLNSGTNQHSATTSFIEHAQLGTDVC